MSVTDEIKARLDVIEIIGETVKLRRAGKNYTGFCPFHPNTRTPAFVVFPDSGTWRCFGQCNEGGDIFKFVMKKEGWDFPQALKSLAQRAGVTLEAPTPEKQAEDEQHERLRTLLEEAANFYRHALLQTPAGQAPLEYLKKRGLTPQTIETFGLGYAPDSWDALVNYFTGKGYTQPDLIEAGLVSERTSGGGVYDRFRHRITFPIRDALGRMTGFGARILRPDDVPKFINSPQSVLFDKGRLLYGLDQARKPIRAQDQVVIVEGYLDVILLHQAGYSNTVSPMGTALTEDQLRLLKRYTRRIILALDADAAGEKATLRGLELTREAMDHSDELTFDARGLLRHEARLAADVRVTTLPPGKDPDEVVLADPAGWKTILESAQPVVIHVVDTLARGRNLDDPKTKSEIAAQVIPLIGDVPNAIEREAYRQRLARLIKVDERALQAGVPVSTRPGRRQPPKIAGAERQSSPLQLGAAQSIARLEKHILHLLLLHPETLYLVDRALQGAGLNRLSPEDFEHTDHQLMARLILQSLDQDDLEPAQFIQENTSDNLLDLERELLAPLEKGEPSLDKRLEDLVRTIMRLRRGRLTESLNQMRFIQEDLQQEGGMDFGTYQQMVVQLSQTRDKLDRALNRPIQIE